MALALAASPRSSTASPAGRASTRTGSSRPCHSSSSTRSRSSTSQAEGPPSRWSSVVSRPARRTSASSLFLLPCVQTLPPFLLEKTGQSDARRSISGTQHRRHRSVAQHRARSCGHQERESYLHLCRSLRLTQSASTVWRRDTRGPSDKVRDWRSAKGWQRVRVPQGDIRSSFSAPAC